MNKFGLVNILFVLTAGCPAFGQINFSDMMPIDTPFSYNYNQVSFGDFDQDGDPDLLYRGTSNDQALSWMEHGPDHKLSNKHNLINDKKVRGVFVTDLDNADGSDIVYTFVDSAYHMAWLKNDGTGHFETAGEIASVAFGEGPEQFYIPVDFDSDTDQDFLLTRYLGLSVQVSLLENTGNGTFKTPQELYVGATGSRYRAMDMNGDGYCDLIQEVISNDQGVLISTIEILTNDGANNFSAPITAANGILTGYYYLADITHDNLPDIVAIDSSGTWGGALWLVKNNGAGGFDAPELIHDADYYQILIADLDGDGDMDILGQYGAENYQMSCNVFVNDGTGGMTTQIEVLTGFPPMWEACYYTTLQDWNSDGLPDFLLQGTHLYFKTNLGGNQFEPRKIALLTRKPDMAYAYVTDMNNDGSKDLIAGPIVTNHIGYYLNNGNNTFKQQDPPVQDSSFTFNYVADLTGDKAPDLIRVQETRIVWFENNGSGRFGPAIPLLNVTDVNYIRSADLDKDGDVDLVIFIQYNGSGGTTSSIIILRNDGLNNFTQIQDLLLGQFSLKRHVLMDTNKDSFPDIVLVNSLNNFIACQNDGNGQFSNNQIIHTESNGSAYPVFTPGDFDSDGDLDILYCDFNALNKLTLLRNNGQGQFNSVATQPMNLSAFSTYVLRPVDLDGDNQLDMLIKGISNIYWLKNTGNGVFASPEVLLTGFDNYFSAIFVDMDSDNDLDIVATQVSSTDIFWFENQTVVGTHQPRFAAMTIDMAPNPATAETTLFMRSGQDVPDSSVDGLEYRVKLYTADGRLVLEHVTADAAFCLKRNNLPAGNYVVQITDGSNSKFLGSGILIWR